MSSLPGLSGSRDEPRLLVNSGLAVGEEAGYCASKSVTAPALLVLAEVELAANSPRSIPHRRNMEKKYPASARGSGGKYPLREDHPPSFRCVLPAQPVCAVPPPAAPRIQPGWGTSSLQESLKAGRGV